ncbi:MAG: vanadium-dependent haloperoxidase, partial [Bacteroidota bacterium]
YPNFYKEYEGGDIGPGHTLNPVTGQPYEPNIVPRGDYARVLAEFWADGPDSETPPGHWFTILNYVNDHPMLEKKFEGEGPVLDDLEWDVKSYFTLGGAMHDAAISAWSVKGYYDYIRPVSAIRYMAMLGQSTDPTSLSYHPAGLSLDPGWIEIVREGDSLLEMYDAFEDPIKSYVWKGPQYIANPVRDEAGVDWIFAATWWPYQRPSFITPPFAGYVSGHSTYSRAAAEVLTRLTGDPFFPGGMGEFEAGQNRFLVFEEGPSVDVNLQWATYRDASDQCSLSRIWGGIHPPVDDIPGRKIGIVVGNRAFDKAKAYMENTVKKEWSISEFQMWPVPATAGQQVNIWIDRPLSEGMLRVVDLQGRVIIDQALGSLEGSQFIQFIPPINSNQMLVVKIEGKEWKEVRKLILD